MIRSYFDLNVWKEARKLVVQIYKLTEYVTKCELYSLTEQMRRAAVSIPSNIAEGKNRFAGSQVRSLTPTHAHSRALFRLP